MSEPQEIPRPADTDQLKPPPSNGPDSNDSRTTPDVSVFDVPGQSDLRKEGAGSETTVDLVDGELKVAAQATGAGNAIESNNTASSGGRGDGEEEEVQPQVKGEKKRGEGQLEEKKETQNSESDAESEPEIPDGQGQEIAMEYTSFLTSRHLYDAYADKLRRKDLSNHKGATLIKSIVDYVRVMEDRMDKLDAALKASKLGKQMDGEAASDTGSEEPSEDGSGDESGGESGDESEGTPPENPWADPILELRFYHCAGVFDGNGSYLDINGPEGTYTCATDPKYMIRVLYEWKEEVARNQSKLADGDLPHPDQIDVIAFTILSLPIAKFFEKQLGLGVDETKVVRIGRPFRPLIRNLQPLREQLAVLDEKYGAAEKDASKGKTDGKELDPAVVGNEATKEEDVLPFPVTSSEKTLEVDEFDRPDARPHFKLLLQFVDRYLCKQVSLFETLKAGKGEKIAYQNLWMLFDTGDTIYCPYQEGGVTVNIDDDTHVTKRRYVPQAYRVVATVGGVPRKKTLAPKNTTVDDNDVLDDPWLRVFMGRRMKSLQQGSAVPTAQRMKEKYAPLHVVCMYIDFDGVKYGTDAEIFVFKPFDGEVDIKSLEAYPLQYLDSELARGAPAIKGTKSSRANQQSGKPDFLLERGRKFIDVTVVSHMSHEGLTVGKSREEINSAVIVDFQLAYQEYQKSFPDSDSVVPTLASLTKFWPMVKRDTVFEYYTSSCKILYCHRPGCVNDLYYDSQKKQLGKVGPKIKGLLEEFETDMTDHEEGLNRFKQYMEGKDLIKLLPGVVPAFALRNRTWVQLDLNQLKYVEGEDNWNKLVLPPGHRDIVQAMVETHSKAAAGQVVDQQEKVEMDLVRGKGKGCIILLHGVPGVGKTSTAECVAAYTKRPLYPITCGDIGYAPEAVEENMGKHFKLAHRWGCVLLLDEADVFLAKRSKSDVKRNGLVSVFLRILEYYSGILFLTTNRVGAIDDAFRSRLHLTLYYPKLTGKQTIKIWKTNLDQLRALNIERERKGRLPIEFNDKKIIKWVKKYRKDIKWNGRQIRNAFQTAIALAEFKAKQASAKKPESPPDKPAMDTSHFKRIANASIQFSEYLLETHGDDEDAVAVRDQIRAMSFKPKAKRIKDVSSDDEDESDSESGSDEEKDSSDESSDNSESDSDSETEKKRKKGKKGKKGSRGKTKLSDDKKEKNRKGKDRKK